MKKDISFSIFLEDGKLVEIILNKKLDATIQENQKNKDKILFTECKKQIDEYLQGKRKKFDLKILISGTAFQEKVWREMIKIPYGETISYSQLAKRIGKPKAYRALANACGKNKLPIIIPCHRVVAQNGLGGYSAGVEVKKKLLEIEKSNC